MRGLIIATGALLLAAPALARDAATPPARVDPARLSDIVRTLASDEYEGRAPGTPGERKTIDFLIARFKAMGLEPGGDKGGWTQAVPLIHTRIGTGGSVSLTVASGQPIPLAQSTQINLTTVRDAPHIDIAKAPLVFVGYGVSAPEAGWDDFKGLDLKGKVAIFLVNDPDFEAVAGEDAVGRFGGRRMTYYGRWTYKFEEAARRGAVAALIVHDTGGAGYGWSTVAASNGENFDIVRSAGDPRVPLQGWIEHDTATRIFTAAGLDLAALRVQARSAGFRPVELKGLSFNAALSVNVERIESANVLAALPGRTHPDESIMFAAHWDAYGAGPADAQGKTIRPGANDDGLGVAGVLELARVFKAAPRAERTMVFALWTGEERGLLGSEYYATHPLRPLSKTAANLTLDILQTAGPASDVILVGAGNSSLDADLTTAAKAQDRVITPETFSERGLFYRADHFSVVRRGVPSLLLMALGGASDLKAGGRAAGQKWLDDYMTCYHKTCDAWSSGWDLRGAAADVALFQTIGGSLANSRSWPAWSKGSEFESIRAKTAAERR
jgi:Zn-dependent M28 family amino/carboxypeptidase